MYKRQGGMEVDLWSVLYYMSLVLPLWWLGRTNTKLRIVFLPIQIVYVSVTCTVPS